MKGIQLSDKGDLKIIPTRKDGKIQSGLFIDDSTIQNAYIVLGLNQGEMKQTPLLGPNLLRFIRAKAGKTAVIKQIRMHLERAGMNYDELKDYINVNLKTD